MGDGPGEPRFEREWTVRFADADPFGIAHYPRIVEAVHDTADRFAESAGVPFWDLVDEHGLGLPIVEVGAEFERPVRAGETVTVELRTDLGDRSVRFDYVGRAADGEVAFTAFEQRVCVPVGGDAAVELPAELRAALGTETSEE